MALAALSLAWLLTLLLLLLLALLLELLVLLLSGGLLPASPSLAWAASFGGPLETTLAQDMFRCTGAAGERLDRRLAGVRLDQKETTERDHERDATRGASAQVWSVETPRSRRGCKIWRQARCPPPRP